MNIVRIFEDGIRSIEVLDISVAESETDIIEVENKVVRFKDIVWEFVTFIRAPVNDVENQLLLYYVPVKTSNTSYNKNPEDYSLVGPFAPSKIDCVCGIKHTAFNSSKDAHSQWCDIKTIDGWDKSIEEWNKINKILRGAPTLTDMDSGDLL